MNKKKYWEKHVNITGNSNNSLVSNRKYLTRPKKIESGTASGQAFFPEPNVDHACAVAALTECDGAQRVYEYPWSSEAEAIVFRQKLIDELAQRGFVHARPWTWHAKTSGGVAKSPSGRDTGIEIRFSFYA